jgi:hypothetical protein
MEAALSALYRENGIDRMLHEILSGSGTIETAV